MNRAALLNDYFPAPDFPLRGKPTAANRDYLFWLTPSGFPSTHTLFDPTYEAQAGCARANANDNSPT